MRVLDDDTPCAHCGKAMRLHGRHPPHQPAHGDCPGFEPPPPSDLAQLSNALLADLHRRCARDGLLLLVAAVQDPKIERVTVLTSLEHEDVCAVLVDVARIVGSTEPDIVPVNLKRDGDVQ